VHHPDGRNRDCRRNRYCRSSLEGRRYFCPVFYAGLVSQKPHQNHQSDKLMANADTALYQSKQNGRNRTTVYKRQDHLNE